ncbi:alpha/beta hydrolase [Microbacterium sp. SORGH_AS_0421]|uniref:alpha/beta hydrolase n=1 Tax=Microbacterium sp. SORGH_AS_0421 TaxID=3041768 RepID=UPI00278D4130|nr:alpha/beta hydrolase [Microbacterium sp. SORGH_AS_0421]MDQ1176364.1 acetyl esterase/lipase [Microbacterium sp. SORGH_AS_0421]
MTTSREHGVRSRTARVILTCLAFLAIGYTVLAQLLAIVPVPWTIWLLQTELTQYVVLVFGLLRDTLGIWNLVVALVGLVCAVVLWRSRPGIRRLPFWLTATATAGTVGVVATTALLAVSIGSLGLGVSPLLPVLPFTGLDSGPSRTVTLGTAGSTTLQADLYLPPGAAPRAGWPVVVSIHGGGFSTGTRGPNAYTGYLPEHGYAVLDVDYRLASSTYHPWDTQVDDIGCSLAWIAGDGRTQNLDPDRIATLGLSSGGNLAVNAAYMSADHTLASSCSPPGTALPTVRAVIAGYPAVDLTGIGDTTAIARQVEQWYVGGPPAQYPDRYRFTDSATHVTAESPPTLIYQGTGDHLVLADRTRVFAELLTERGITNRYVEYPGLEHGTGDTTGTLTASAEASRQLALDWLQRHDG